MGTFDPCDYMNMDGDDSGLDSYYDNLHLRGEYMAKVTGVVTAISKKKAYNIQIDDGDWYGYGFDAPEFSKGDKISFTVTKNGKWENVDVDSVEIHKTSGGQSSAGTTERGSDLWNDTQKAICWQSARACAIDTVNNLYTHGILKPSAKAALRQDEYDSHIREYTEKYYAETNDPLVNDLLSVDEDMAPGPAKEDDEYEE